MKTRAEEHDELVTSFGFLIDPIRRLVFAEEDPCPQIPYIMSQFRQDLGSFREEVLRFCSPGKHRFQVELDTIIGETAGFASFLSAIRHPENVEHARSQFDVKKMEVLKAIRAIPCDDPGKILPSESPYSTYLRLRAICRNATSRLELFDPYLDSETFHRYLNTIADGVRVLIVTSSDIMDLPATTSPTSSKPPLKAFRRDRIVALSELLALQFPDRYEFRVSSEQHDRHIRVDETILHLGGSAKDAGKNDYYTISNLDPNQSSHAFLDGVIARATEWYGPSVRSHRRV